MCESLTKGSPAVYVHRSVIIIAGLLAFDRCSSVTVS